MFSLCYVQHGIGANIDPKNVQNSCCGYNLYNEISWSISSSTPISSIDPIDPSEAANFTPTDTYPSTGPFLRDLSSGNQTWLGQSVIYG